MKYSKLLAILLLSSIISISACGDKAADTRKKEARESLGVVNPPTTPNTITPPPPTPEPAQNAQGVWHYTCAKGCAGGAGAAGPCATCGGTLAHNSAYHSNTNSPLTTPQVTTPPQGSSPQMTIPTTASYSTNPTTTPTTPQFTPPPPTTEPAQNAAGVWHYTCSKGCAGGAGSAGTCASCSGPLAHNAAYH